MKPTNLLFWLLIFACLTPWVTAPVALLIGFVTAALGWVPDNLNLSQLVKRMLAVAIIAMGFGVHLDTALAVTGEHLGLMVVSIVVTLVVALVVGRWLAIDTKTSHLLGSGTAICGGSAIAAVGPAIQARSDQMALALAAVFTLNAIALLVFPVLGHWLGLDQVTFGVWAAIAIHDTSSVVGAAQAYGDEALQVATTLKLARALWIIPLALISALIYQRATQQEQRTRVSIPLFIVGYVIAMVFATYVPQLNDVYQGMFIVGKQLLVVCLFLVGASITWAKLRAAGVRTLILAALLWVLIATGSLLWLLH